MNKLKNKILICNVFNVNTKSVYHIDANNSGLSLNAPKYNYVVYNNDLSVREYTYNVEHSFYLSGGKLYSLLSLDEETKLLHDYYRNSINSYDGCDEDDNDCDNEDENNNRKKSFLGRCKSQDLSKNAIIKVKAFIKLFNSLMPYFVREIKRFFKVNINNIEKIDDYISKCKDMLDTMLKKKNKIKMGVSLIHQLYFDIKACIRELYGEIGGNFQISGHDVKERTKIYNVRKDNPNITNEQIAILFGHKPGTKWYTNFINKIKMYDDWQSSGYYSECEDDSNQVENNIVDYNNDIDAMIEREDRKAKEKEFYDYLKKNFSEKDCGILAMRYNFFHEYTKQPTYDEIGIKYKCTKQNVSAVIKKIQGNLRSDVQKGLISNRILEDIGIHL